VRRKKAKIAVTRMNPLITSITIERSGSSSGFLVAALACRGCVGFFIVLYMTARKGKGNIARKEIVYSLVKKKLPVLDREFPFPFWCVLTCPL
jgi:hypothetical protein